MEKVYINQKEFQEGDIIYFEMPPFCSGEYAAPVNKDQDGMLYINKDDDFFKGCRDYRINKPYWS